MLMGYRSAKRTDLGVPTGTVKASQHGRDKN